MTKKKLNRCERKVLEFIEQHEQQHLSSTPAAQFIADSICYSVGSVRNALTRLEREGYIAKTPQSNKRKAPERHITKFNSSVKFCEHTISRPKTYNASVETDADKSIWHGTENTTDTQYWQFMELIERNTDTWCKARRVALAKAPAPTQQQVLHFPPDPEWYACFFWDDTHEQAA